MVTWCTRVLQNIFRQYLKPPRWYSARATGGRNEVQKCRVASSVVPVEWEVVSRDSTCDLSATFHFQLNLSCLLFFFFSFFLLCLRKYLPLKGFYVKYEHKRIHCVWEMTFVFSWILSWLCTEKHWVLEWGHYRQRCEVKRSPQIQPRSNPTMWLAIASLGVQRGVLSNTARSFSQFIFSERMVTIAFSNSQGIEKSHDANR